MPKHCRMTRGVTLLLTTVLVGATLSGCGDDGSQDGERRSVLVDPPDTPSEDECTQLAGDRSAGAATTEDPPAPGRYAFASRGVIETRRDGKVVERRQLPKTMDAYVTDARTVGGVSCFRVQNRLTGEIADTATFALRGEELFLVAVELQSGGDLVTYVPNPAIRSLDPKELEWTGTFAGTTQGDYQASVVGRRTIKVGGRRVRTVGVELRSTFAGDLQGWQTATTWLSVDEKLPVIIDSETVREYGLDQYRAKFHAVLLSVEPEE